MLNTYEEIKLYSELSDRNRKITCLTLDNLELEKELNTIKDRLELKENKLFRENILLTVACVYSIVVSLILCCIIF